MARSAKTPTPSSTRGELERAPEARARLEGALERLDAVARLMDDQFELPLVRWRIGLDPIIGMIPGGGDWAMWCVSVYIFWEAARLGAPLGLLGRMAVHIALDLLGGYVPAVGDLFDAAFKANRRNVELLRAHFGARPELGSSLPVKLPEGALEPRPRAVRYAVGALLTLALLALASGPAVLLYLWLGGGGG